MLNPLKLLDKLLKFIFLSFIQFYQKAISPLLGSNCRFYPTCSSYAKEALTKHNFFKGTVLSVWRILRCNPWNRGGFDPVPPYEIDKKETINYGNE